MQGAVRPPAAVCWMPAGQVLLQGVPEEALEERAQGEVHSCRIKEIDLISLQVFTVVSVLPVVM